MTDQSESPLAPSEHTFSVTRVFDAPRDLVFQALSQCERLVKWWGPKGFPIYTATLDFRPGGVFHYELRSPNGQSMWGKFFYREISAPERIVFVSSFSDEEGNTTRAPFSETWPLEILNTMTLKENDGKTTLTIAGYPIHATSDEMEAFRAHFSSMEQGFNGTLDQLNDYLAAMKAEPATR